VVWGFEGIVAAFRCLFMKSRKSCRLHRPSLSTSTRFITTDMSSVDSCMHLLYYWVPAKVGGKAASRGSVPYVSNVWQLGYENLELICRKCGRMVAIKDAERGKDGVKVLQKHHSGECNSDHTLGELVAARYNL
jgi:hypothetical protein